MPRSKPIRTMSQAEYAGHRGVTRKTVTVWKQAGHLVLTPDGRVDVAATDLLLDERPECYRGGSTRPAGNTPEVTVDPDADDNLSLADAIRRKENYLGLLRKRELEISDGEWARIEDVGLQVEREHAMVRERMLGIVGKMGADLSPDVAARLDAEIREALDDLSDPEDFDAVRDAKAKRTTERV